MLRTMLKSEIHRATVTRADPHHAGAVTVDPMLLDAADLLAGERITIVDATTGARLEAHVVAGERGSGVLGAPAHLVAPGDTVSLVAYGLMDAAQAAVFEPRLVLVDDANAIVEPGVDSAPEDPGPRPAETAEAALLDALLQPES
jgi:aspartate 1-decarboxylase